MSSLGAARRFRVVSSGSVNRVRVMDEVPPPGDSWKAYRVGPRCGGGNLGHFSSGRPRRGQAAAPLAFCGRRSEDVRLRRLAAAALSALKDRTIDADPSDDSLARD